MKLTLLVPPCYDHRQPPERTAGCTRVVYPAPNIYELSVAAVLEQSGRDEVGYRDFVLHGGREAFERFCREDDSDVILIWSVNLSIATDLSCIERLRAYRPELKIIMMGPGPTHYIGRCLADRFTYIVRGEPEASVAELIEKLRTSEDAEGVAGVSYLDKTGRVVNNPPRALIEDLDSLPWAARHLLGDAVYHNPKLKTTPYTTMITSRNCPYGCIYCVPSSLSFAREIESRRQTGHKPRITFRSLGSIEAEVSALASSGYRAIGFMDDNFIWTSERTADICAIMRKYGIVWGCQARVDAISEEIAAELGRSGCGYVDLGVESFDDAILADIGKGITSSQIYEAIGHLKRYGVPVKLNILIGCSPLETPETVRHTLREAKRLDVDQVMFNIVSPFPGTEYYNRCKANGWFVGEDYTPTDVQRESILNLPHLSARQMERLLFRNNVSYFLSWRFASRQLRRFRSASELIAALKALKIKILG